MWTENGKKLVLSWLKARQYRPSGKALPTRGKALCHSMTGKGRDDFCASLLAKRGNLWTASCLAMTRQPSLRGAQRRGSPCPHKRQATLSAGFTPICCKALNSCCSCASLGWVTKGIVVKHNALAGHGHGALASLKTR